MQIRATASRIHLVCVLLPRQNACPSAGTCVSSSDSLPASHRQSRPFTFDSTWPGTAAAALYSTGCINKVQSKVPAPVDITRAAFALSQDGLAAYLIAPAAPQLYEASSHGKRMASTSSAALVYRASQLGADWEWIDSSRCTLLGHIRSRQ